jgi:hypothetical protein
MTATTAREVTAFRQTLVGYAIQVADAMSMVRAAGESA